MFSGVPAIVYDKTIGGAKYRINSATGVLSSDEELSEKIEYMLDHYREFDPRNWITQHSGSVVATRRLNDIIKHITAQAGEKYTRDIVEKTNSPNLTYKNRKCRDLFKEDYEFILSCQRRLANHPKCQNRVMGVA
jgi:hypothetical protein